GLAMLAMTTSGSAGGSARRWLFGVQIRRAICRHIFFDPLLERGSAGQSAGDDIARECLGFHDRDVWLAGDRNQIVRSAALHRSRGTARNETSTLMHRL